MFCPNCGTQNESAATQCKNCGFKLSGLSASKFKGTMMLNTDQTVQELIEAHKKKQSGAPTEEQSGAADNERPSSSRISGYPGAPKTVLQPPRASSSRRRMAGTMMGVAPQVGGVAPVTSGEASRVDPGATESSRGGPTPTPAAAHASSERGASDAQSAGPGAAPTSVSARSDSGPSSHTPASARLSARLAPTAAMPVVEAEGPDRESAAAAPSIERGEGASWPSVQPARGGTAATAPMPAQIPLSGEPSARPRLVRPLEVVLILATCGLYGLVLLFKQRRQRPKTES